MEGPDPPLPDPPPSTAAAHPPPPLPLPANPPVDTATTVATSKQHNTSPARLAELCHWAPSGAAKTRDAVGTRPGIRFQDLLLHDFHTTADPSFLGIPSSDQGMLWVTPSNPVSLTAIQVSNTLSFHLAASPARLRAKMLTVNVFSVAVANPAVGKFILIHHRFGSGRFELLLHPSMASAREFAARLNEAPGFTPHLPASHLLPNGAANCVDGSSFPPPGMLLDGETRHLRGKRYAYLLTLTTADSTSLPPLLPTPPDYTVPDSVHVRDGRCPNSSLLEPNKEVMEVTKPYLAAALSPGAPLAPVQALPKRFSPPPNACFRCLSAGHRAAECRDPIRCRLCGASGHMENRCKTPRWPPRRQTPWPRRPSVPVPVGRYPVHPVPFSPRTSGSRSPPPSSPPPPSPFTLVTDTPVALLPVNVTASSSSAAPELQTPPPFTPTAPAPAATQNPRPPTSPLRPASPLRPSLHRSTTTPHLPSLAEIHITNSPTRPSSVPAASDNAPVGSRSPPPPAPAFPGPAHQVHGSVPGPVRFVDSASESVEEVDSDGSPFRLDPQPDLPFPDEDILWMPDGDMERAGRFAYVFLNDAAPTDSPAPFIHAAISSVAFGAHFRMFPSSRGHMLLRFDSRAARDAVVDMAPFVHDGGRVSLERSEETSNRFVARQDWLVAVTARSFPDEYWTPTGIPAAFRKLGTVVEIDQDCLEDDYSSLRVVVARTRPDRIPDVLHVGNPRGGLGSTFPIEPTKIWPRAEQLDGLGRLRPFFPRPPPRGPAGMRGLPPFPLNHPFRNVGSGPALHGANLGGAHDAPFGPAHSDGFDGVDQLRSFILVGGPIGPARAPNISELCLIFRRLYRNLPTLPAPPLPTPPPPPPSPVPEDPPPQPPAKARRGRGRKLAAHVHPKRASARLAAKEPKVFVAMADKATRRKALRDELTSCSDALKKQIKGRKILKMRNPLGALDLGRLARAAGLSCSARHAVAVAAAAPTVT